MNIFNQLRILLAIPMVILIGGFAYIVDSMYTNLQKIQHLREHAIQITHITDLLHQMADNYRCTTAVFHDSLGIKSGYE